MYTELKPIDRLRELVPRGTRVFTILRRAARSGMSREIGLVVMSNGRPLHPNWLACQVLGLRQGDRDGIVVRGCGMDMGFAVVTDLAQALYADPCALSHEWL